MSKLARDTRLLIEEIIDDYLENENIQSDTRETLDALNIIPNSETALSHIAGIVIGIVLGGLIMRSLADGEEPDQKYIEEQTNEAIDLLSRRVFELRQHFEKTKHL
jgi:hypothetical protein